METLLEFFQGISFAPHIISVLIAAFIGGVIGIEREYRDKSAGFRTMILIAIGSCLFTIFSQLMGDKDGETTRIAASIVTGIGFLGAGVIMKEGAAIRGITTAASIWLVASLGVGAGIGEYGLVLTVTTLVMVVLLFLPPFEHWLDRFHDFSEFHITVKNSDLAEEKILDIFDEFGVRIVEVRRSKLEKGERVLHVKANMNVEQREELGAVFVSEKSVIAFEN